LIPASPPPWRPLQHVLRAPDSSYEFPDRREASETHKRRAEDGHVEWIWLFPHQDPGTRVTEGEFLDGLAIVVARQPRSGR
jgi:hypothetical protein